jgi:hypothetical protein
MLMTEVPWWAIRGVLSVVFVAGLVWGVRRILAKRSDGWFWVIGFGLLLCEQALGATSGTLGLRSPIELQDFLAFAQMLLVPIGVFTLITSALWSLFFRSAAADPPVSIAASGKHLLGFSLVSLVVLPTSFGGVAWKLFNRELVAAIVMVVLFTLPSIVTWLLASRHLQDLPAGAPNVRERRFTLGAYWIASIGAIFGIFVGTYLFVVLATLEGWIDPQ